MSLFIPDDLNPKCDVRFYLPQSNAIVSGMPFWESMTCSMDYYKPQTDFSVTFGGKSAFDTVTALFKVDARAILYLNGNPYCFGYCYSYENTSSKAEGRKVTLHFKSMMGLLDEADAPPYLYFSGQETVLAVLSRVLLDFKSYNKNMIDVEILDGEVKAYNNNYYAGGLKQKAATTILKQQDIQISASESVYTFMQRICHRHGFHMRDQIDPDTLLPIIQITVPTTIQYNSGSPIPPAYTFVYSPDINIPGTINTSNIKDAELQIAPATMPSIIIGYGGVYNQANLAYSAYKCIVANELVLDSISATPILQSYFQNPEIQLAPSFNSEVGVALTKMGIKPLMQANAPGKLLAGGTSIDLDDWLLRSGWFNKFNQEKTWIKYERHDDCSSLQDLYSKIYFNLRKFQHDAVTLTYKIYFTDILVPDNIVQVQDTVHNIPGQFMWINSVNFTCSKKGGLEQTIQLKIPNTLAVY